MDQFRQRLIGAPFFVIALLIGAGAAFAAKPAPSKADLSVTMTDSPDPASSGAPITYSIQVVNQGPAGATSVKLIDTYPSGSTPTSATSSQGSCSIGSSITCSIGQLASGDSAAVTIEIQTAGPGQLTNSATVSADQSDAASANNQATETTEVLDCYDCRYLTMTDTPDPAQAGEAILYTVEFDPPLSGHSVAHGTRATMTLPEATEFAGSTTNCSRVDKKITCTGGTSLSAKIVLRPLKVGTLTNKVVAFIGNRTTLSATATTTSSVLPPRVAGANTPLLPPSQPPAVGSADLALDHEGSYNRIHCPGTEEPNCYSRFDWLARNLGTVPAHNAKLMFAFHDPLGKIEVEGNSCTEEAGVFTCQLGTLTPGAVATITVRSQEPVMPDGGDYYDSWYDLALTSFGVVTTDTPESNLVNNQHLRSDGVDVADAVGQSLAGTVMDVVNAIRQDPKGYALALVDTLLETLDTLFERVCGRFCNP